MVGEVTEEVIARDEGKARVRKPRGNAFSAAKRQRFLDALALTCNVRVSAEAAGVDYTTVYWHRVRDDVFAGQWREALDVGCDRLEALLMEHGGAGQRLEPADPERAITDAGGAPPPFDFDKALKALQYYRSKHSLRTPQSGGRPSSRAAALEALDCALKAAERRTAREQTRNG